MLWEGHMKKPYDILFSNDIVQKACDTYSHNFDHEALCCDVKELDCSLLPEAMLSSAISLARIMPRK